MHSLGCPHARGLLEAAARARASAPGRVRLSEITGVPSSRISNYERGWRNPARTTRAALASALGCTGADLTLGSTRPQAGAVQDDYDGQPVPGLAAARKRAGMTQIALAEASGVHKGCVSMFELDRSRPTSAALQALADALGCGVGVLVAGE